MNMCVINPSDYMYMIKPTSQFKSNLSSGYIYKAYIKSNSYEGVLQISCNNNFNKINASTIK